MDTTVSKFTVLFEEPFWIGVFEIEYDGKYEACKITFGAEPKDYEIYEFILKSYFNLRFSPYLKAERVMQKQINPKRMQRIIQRQVKNTGMGTKAQQALKIQHEQRKSERKSYSKKQSDEEKVRQFELRQQKRKEKHRGH